MKHKLVLVFVLSLIIFATGAHKASALSLTSVQTGNFDGSGTSAWTTSTTTGIRTGRITTSNSSTAVTGSGTLFTSEVNPGNVLKTTGLTTLCTVSSVTDDTHLTCTANAGSTNSNINYGTTGVGPGDSVTVAAGHTVTVNNNNTVAALTVCVSGTCASAPVMIWTAGKTLTVTGAVTVNGGSPTNSTIAPIVAVRDGTLIANGITLNRGNRNNSGEITRLILNTGTITTTGGLTFNTGGGGAATTVFLNTGGGTINIAGTVSDNANTFSINSTSTVHFTGATTINGAYTWGGAVTLDSGAGVTSLVNTTTFTGNLTVNTGATLRMGNFAFTESGTTNLTGTIDTATGSTGNRTFTGAVTVNSGGVWDLSGQNPFVIFGAGITHNGTTFNNGSGGAQFNATAALAGSSNMTLTGLTLSGVITLTNNSTGVVTSDDITAFSGTWKQGSGSYLKLTGSGALLGSVSSFDDTTNINNTIEFSGNATVNSMTYGNLILSGSSITTPASGSNITVRGNLTIGNGTTITKGASGGGTFILAKGGEQTYIDNNGTPVDIGPVQISANSTNSTLHLASNAKFTSLTIDASQTFKPYGSTVTLTTTGTGISNSGTFYTGSSTVDYTGDGATVSCGVNYYNLGLKPASTGTQTICTGSSQNLTVFNNFQVGNGGTSGATAATYDPNIYVGGALTITANNTYTTGAGTTTIAGAGTPLVINGSLDATTDCGSVLYTGTTATNITPATYCTLAFGTSTSNIYTLGTAAGQSFTIQNNFLYAGDFSHFATITASRWNPSITIKGSFLASTNYSPYIPSINTLTFKDNGATIPIYDLATTLSDLGNVRVSVGTGNTTVTPKTSVKLTTLTLDNSQIFSLSSPATAGTNLSLFVTGTGTPIVQGGGTLALSTSTVNYVGTSTSNIVIATSSYAYLGLGTDIDTIATTYDVGSTSVSEVLNIGNASNSSNKDVLSLSGGLLLAGTTTPLNLTAGGTFTTNSQAVTYTGSSTVSCSNITYYNLLLKPSGTNSQMICSASGRTLNVTNDLTIGDGTNAGANAGIYNPAIVIGRDVTIAANAIATSTSGTISIGRNFTANGTFVPNNGTVDFNNTQTSTVQGTVSLDFYNLNASSTASASKTIDFYHGVQYNILGRANFWGAASFPLTLDSDDGTNQWTVKFTNATTSNYLNVLNSACANGSATVTLDPNSTKSNSGNCWVLDDIIILSGTAYLDEGGTLATLGNGGACNGSGEIGISVDGAAPSSVSCSNADGTWSSNVGVLHSGNQVVAIFLNGQTDKSVIYTKTTSTPSNIQNMSLIKNRISLYGNLSNSDIGTYDQLDDSDIPVMYQSSALTASSTKKLIVNTGYTYTPGSNTTIDDVEVMGTYTGGSETLKLTGTGTSATCTDDPGTVAPLCINSGTFTPTSNNVEYTGDGSVLVGNVTYYDLTIDPSLSASRTYTGPSGLTVNNNFNINPASGGANTLTFNPVSTSTISRTLTIQNSSSANTVFDTTINAYGVLAGAIYLTAGNTLKANGSIINLTGGGTPFIVSGTFNYGTSTVLYNSTSATTIASTTYNALNLKPSGTVTYTLPSGTVNTASLIVGDGTNALTTTAATNNPTISATKNINISTNSIFTTGNGDITTASFVNSGTLNGSGSGTFMATSTASGSGTINLTGGTFECRASSSLMTCGSSSANWTLYNFTASNSSNSVTTQVRTFGSTTVNGVITIGRAADTLRTSLTQAGTNDVIDLKAGSGATPIVLNGSSILFGSNSSHTIKYSGDLVNIVYPGSGGAYGNLVLGNGTYVWPNTDTNVRAQLLINPGTTFVKNSGKVLFTGGSAIGYIVDYSSGQDLGNIQISKQNGVTNSYLTLLSNAKVTQLIVDSGNTFIAGTSTLTILGTGTGASRPFENNGTSTVSAATINYVGTSSAVDIESLTYKNLGVGTDSDVYVNTYELYGSTTVANTLAVGNDNSTGSDFFSTANNYLNVGSINVTSKGNFSPFGSTVDVTGDGITNNGAFTYGTSTINLVPSASSTVLVQGSADTGFYNLNATSTSLKYLKFSNKTYSFFNNLVLIGDIYQGNINLNSTDDTSLWNLFIDSAATYSMGYLSVKNSACASNTKTISSNSTIIDNGFNGGCWSFSTAVRGGGGGGSSHGAIPGEESGTGAQQTGGGQGGDTSTSTPSGEGSGSGSQQNGGGSGGGASGDVGLLQRFFWVTSQPDFRSKLSLFSSVFNFN